MSTSRVTTSDGTVTVTTDDEAATAVTPGPDGGAPVVLHPRPGHANFTFGVHSDRPFDGASFFVGLLVGMLVLLLLQRGRRRAQRRDARGVAHAAAIGPQPVAESGMAAEVAALARRTATLETIVTDPAHRTAREIDALR